MKPIIILYVPVIHEGYLKFFEKWSKKADTLYVLGDFSADGRLHREIRALDPKVAVNLIKATGLFKSVKVLEPDGVHKLKTGKIITATDMVCSKFISQYLEDKEIIYDSIFLRWDEINVYSNEKVEKDYVSDSDFDRGMIFAAIGEAKNSSDWWRRVGCVLVKNGKILKKARNIHLPSDHTPYAVGDPRDFIKAGTRSELTSALHSEQQIIAWAANKGVSLKGSHLYVTVFPCPVCAKLIAHSGISKLFYASGHASLDGQDVLKLKEVKIIFVDMKKEESPV